VARRPWGGRNVFGSVSGPGRNRSAPQMSMFSVGGYAQRYAPGGHVGVLTRGL
jgi:hypothetical protein